MSNTMNDQEFELWLQNQMKSADYIEDDGFTDSLMQSLPQRPRRRSQVKARLLVSFAAMLACMLVYFILPVQIPVQLLMETVSQPLAHIWLFAGLGAGLMSVAVFMLWNDRNSYFEI